MLVPGGRGPGEFAGIAADADVVLTCYQPVTEALFATARRLRAVVKYGVGIDAIDTDAARRHRVPVVNVPDYASDTVAEAAFLLLLALARKLPALSRQVRTAGWVDPTPAWLGTEVAGSTVGLVGVGRIGSNLARKAGAGFGARVIGYDPNLTPDQLRARGVQPYDDLHALLATSDFVSLHATLTPQTRRLIGSAELAAMKPTAYLINVSRGELVDEPALLQALQDGTIAGAGLDTYGREPLRPSGHPLSPLLDMDNVVLTPHLAFYTGAAMRRLQDEALQRCAEALAGGPLTVLSDDPRLTAQQSGVHHRA